MIKANLPRLCVLAVLAVAGRAQLAPPAREIPLYPGPAPGSENWNYPEKSAGTPDKPQAQNIARPVLLYYPADKATAVGTATIVAPGGGFRMLMMSYEGVDVAQRLNRMGVDAFVLKYRTIYVGPDHPQGDQNVPELAGADGQQAVRLVRQRAAEFGVLSNRIGIIGYSAGGAVVLSNGVWSRRWKAGFRRSHLCRRRELESAATGSSAAVHRRGSGRPGSRLPRLDRPVRRVEKGGAAGRAARVPDRPARLRSKGWRRGPLPGPSGGVAESERLADQGVEVIAR